MDDPKTDQPTSLATVTRDLRAAKAAEHTLRQYKQIVAAIPDSVSLVDRQYRYQIINAEYLRRTGKPETAIVGHSVAEVMGEAVFQHLVQQHLDRGLQGQTEHYQSWFEFAASGRQFIDVIYSPYRDEQNELAGVVVTARDITSLKQAEEALHQSEQRLTLALSAAHAGAWEWNVMTKQAIWSEENYRLLGLVPGNVEAHYDRWLECVHPDERADMKQCMDQAMAQGRDLNIECRVVWPDGSLHWVHNVGKMRYDETGKPVAMYGIQIDITERKRAEQVLRESERRFATLANSAPVLIWVTGPDRCEFINQAYATFFGVEEASIQEHDQISSIHPEDRQGYLDLYHRALAQRAPFETQVRRRRADGCYRWMKSSGQPRFSATGEWLGYAGCLLDITELKQAEDTLRQADQRKDEFLAMLAHELRNPLAPIRSAVQILERLGPAEPKQQWARDVIERHVKHLARLVDDLLDSARLVQGKITLKKEPVELATIIQQTVEAAQPLLDARQHQFHLTMPHSTVWLEGDPVRLVQVLFNLLDNAAKYTEPGGRIELEAEALGAEVAVRVRDNGPGLPPALLSRVFELFEQGEHTLDRAQGGLGIGLTLVRRLVELHGGRVEAHSASPGQGAEFTVWLPVQATGAPPVETVVPSVTARPAPNRRILLVDD
ncbi:MAG TPA: PAS domain S-box protein, partial [Candidatus Competibacteraceae bacterium]|nr:PAS domain S-box protein [Candidatus Competibacteraceae bacterium]